MKKITARIFPDIFAVIYLIFLAPAVYGIDKLYLVLDEDQTFPIESIAIAADFSHDRIDGKRPFFEDSLVDVIFEIRFRAPACYTKFYLKQVVAQNSESDSQNYTDLYFRVISPEPKCDHTGQSMQLKAFEYSRRFVIERRGAYVPLIVQREGHGQLYHLHFDIGMERGLNRWRQHVLDLSVPKEPVLRETRSFSYVEGRVVE